MSCNGCRVLRKGCSETCALRSCLQWIPSPQAQGYATLFLAKFFGRSDLISFISSVPLPNRPALFQSLLFEACGRTINPVNGAVGLLWSGNWGVCQAAVDTVLSGGVLRPFPLLLDEDSSHTTLLHHSHDQLFRPLPMPSQLFSQEFHFNNNNNPSMEASMRRTGDSTPPATSLLSGESEMMLMTNDVYAHNHKIRLLNLFV